MDLLTFVEFEFEKLNNATEEEVAVFLQDSKECRLDNKRIVSRLSASGNKEIVEKNIR
jgi:hypothetical protein